MYFVHKIVVTYHEARYTRHEYFFTAKEMVVAMHIAVTHRIYIQKEHGSRLQVHLDCSSHICHCLPFSSEIDFFLTESSLDGASPIDAF